MSDSSPGPGVTPSMVVTAEPPACPANIRHERTAMPTNNTVQAPQTPCSQPACAPVSASWSRRQSSNVVRGSTSSSCAAPLMLSSMRMVLFFLRVAQCIGNGAGGEIDGGAAAVGGRSVQIGERIDTGKRLGNRRLHFGGIERRAVQLLF